MLHLRSPYKGANNTPPVRADPPCPGSDATGPPAASGTRFPMVPRAGRPPSHLGED